MKGNYNKKLIQISLFPLLLIVVLSLTLILGIIIGVVAYKIGGLPSVPSNNQEESAEQNIGVDKMHKELEAVKKEILKPVPIKSEQKDLDFEEFIKEVAPINNLLFEGMGNINKAISANNEIQKAVLEGREYDINEPFRFFNLANGSLSTAKRRAQELSYRTPSENMWVIDNIIVASDLFSESASDFGDWLFDADLSEQGKERKQTQGDIKYTRAFELTRQVIKFVEESGVFE